MAKKNSSTKPELTEAQKQQVKRDNFARVLPPRVNKAVKAIDLVGDCTLPSYLYTKDQAAYVVGVLQKAVDGVTARFSGEKGKSGGFTLPQ